MSNENFTKNQTHHFGDWYIKGEWITHHSGGRVLCVAVVKEVTVARTQAADA